MFFLGWHEIRQTLYESLPEGVVEFGKRFDRYSDEGDAGVHVHFKVSIPLESLEMTKVIHQLLACNLNKVTRPSLLALKLTHKVTDLHAPF